MSMEDILRVAEPGVIYTVDDMMRLLESKGMRPVSRPTLSSDLARLARRGKLERVSLGRYRLKADE